MDNTKSAPHMSQIFYDQIHRNERFNLSTGNKEDFACFAIWETGRSKEQEIISDLQNHFEILGDFLIRWSDKNYDRNIARLYERNENTATFNGYDRKIGKPPFRFIVVKDPNPHYSWKKSVSGVIEPSNEKVVAAKYRYRDLFDKKFQVHSSNNIGEFLFQTALILGTEVLEQLISSKNNFETQLIDKDLEGSDGWEDWSHFFRTLNFCSNYLVLRNYESLPHQLNDGDIDFLCDNFQRLASAANLLQHKNKPYKGKLFISGNGIPADIRFISDGYYHSAWEKDMLDRKHFNGGFYIPANDDYFFSLLYHCKVHKSSVKEKYKELLENMADEMRFDWFNVNMLEDDKSASKILYGYMKSKSYYYENPIDLGVGKNDNVIINLPTVSNYYGNNTIFIKRFHHLLIQGIKNPSRIPDFFVNKIKKSIR